MLLNAAFREQHEHCTLELTASVTPVKAHTRFDPVTSVLEEKGAQETTPFPADLEAILLTAAEERR